MDGFNNEKNGLNIALIGFMGTGKTTLGKIVAEKLGYKFIDTDQYIEQNEGNTITEIFNSKGEDYFRELESNSLKKLLENQKQVIATGGGIVINPKNRELLLKKCFVVSLQASPKNIYFRVKSNSKRPLINTPHPEKTIKNLMHKRYKYYKIGHLKLRSDKNNINNLVNKIVEKYKKYIRK